jgi:antibiotic biosynthesis monooxygenase (ABM) superfamily enzyme
MPVRTLLLTIVLVPLMVFVLVPILSRALAMWLWR